MRKASHVNGTLGGRLRTGMPCEDTGTGAVMKALKFCLRTAEPHTIPPRGKSPLRCRRDRCNGPSSWCSDVKREFA